MNRKRSPGCFLREDDRCSYQDRPFLLELNVPLAQSDELLPLSSGQRPHRAQAAVDLGLLHPVPERLRVHPEITTSLSQSNSRRQDQRNRIVPEVLAALRWTSQSGYSLPGLMASFGCPSRRGNFTRRSQQLWDIAGCSGAVSVRDADAALWQPRRMASFCVVVVVAARWPRTSPCSHGFASGLLDLRIYTKGSLPSVRRKGIWTAGVRNAQPRVTHPTQQEDAA